MENYNGNALTLKTGDVNYAIRNEYGEEIGTIRFNPADMDIMRRCDEVERWFKNIDIPEEPTIDDFFNLTDKIKAQFDFLLNRNVSGEVFKICNPLTLTADGTYFYSNVLEAVMQIIADTVKERRAKSEQRIAEAVAELTENE